jgi:hypothetical protein
VEKLAAASSNHEPMMHLRAVCFLRPTGNLFFMCFLFFFFLCLDGLVVWGKVGVLFVCFWFGSGERDGVG